MDISDAIHAYYKLKKKYNSKYESTKSKIIKSDVSIKEKRTRIKNYKRKCVKCKRDCGSFFYKEENMLIAKCGDETQPCDLNIKINVGSYMNLNALHDVINKDIESCKREIVNIKLKLLYNIEREDIIEKQFSEMKNMYETLNTGLENVLDDFNERKIIEIDDLTTSDKVNKDTIININNIKIKNTINSFKNLIENYNSETMIDKKYAILEEAIDLYINDLQEILKKQKELVYEINTMIQEKDENTLVQIKNLYENMEFVLSEPEILSNKK